MDLTKKIKKQIIKTKSKDLLRIDNKYFDNEVNQKESIISNMLNEKKKPNFYEIQKPKFMEDLKSFLPQFKQDTEDLLSNRTKLQLNQIDIVEKGDINIDQILSQDVKDDVIQSDSSSDSSISMPANVNQFINSDEENVQNQKQYVEMNIYVGVFDTLKNQNSLDQEIIIPQDI